LVSAGMVEILTLKARVGKPSKYIKLSACN
jgi:hypothetical protein